jgi:hypothetical protein
MLRLTTGTVERLKLPFYCGAPAGRHLQKNRTAGQNDADVRRDMPGKVVLSSHAQTVPARARRPAAPPLRRSRAAPSVGCGQGTSHIAMTTRQAALIQLPSTNLARLAQCHPHAHLVVSDGHSQRVAGERNPERATFAGVGLTHVAAQAGGTRHFAIAPASRSAR